MNARFCGLLGVLLLIGQGIALSARPQEKVQAAPQGKGQAPATVDYAAIRKLMEAGGSELSKSAKAQYDAGVKRPDWKFDTEKLVIPIRDMAKGGGQELKDACLIAEFLMLRGYTKTEGLLDKVLTQVAPSSPGWNVSPRDIQSLRYLLAPGGEAYLSKMMTEAAPEVRALLLGSEVTRLAEKGEFASASEVYQRLATDFPTHRATKAAERSLKAEQQTAIGSDAPDFQVKNLENAGETFTKATFKGKYLLIDFWGTWCGFCVAELPTTHRLYQAFKDKGLEILSLAVNDPSPDTVMTFRQKPGLSMPWKHAYLGKGKDVNPVLDAYGVRGFPMLFLLGPDGKVVARGSALREDRLEATLKRFMK